MEKENKNKALKRGDEKINVAAKDPNKVGGGREHFENLKEENTTGGNKKKRKRRRHTRGSSQYTSHSTDTGDTAKLANKVTLKIDPELRKYLSFDKDKTLIKIESRDAGYRRNLNMEPYYHGFMSRDVADKITMTDGQFLLRRAEIEKRQIYIITVQTMGQKEHHMIMRTNDNKHFWIKKYCFNSVCDLIRFHMDRLVPIKDGIIISHWVDKDLWLLSHDQVRLTKPIGSGAFGQVFAGFLNLGTFKQKIPVAVKTMKGSGMTNDAKLEFLREASIMTEFKSDYVVKFYGVCTQKDPVMIIIEMADKGSLLDNLKSPDVQGKDWDIKRHRWARHINLGLQYIHSRETLHRDIAARNVLIGANDKAKIADFGLSLRQKNIVIKNMKKLPIRWMPPETLAFGAYLPESEVWSFGVVVFEIYTNGERPYSKISGNKEVKNGIISGTISLLDSPKFPFFPQDIQNVLNLCFARKVVSRLNMKEVYLYFDKTDGVSNSKESDKIKNPILRILYIIKVFLLNIINGIIRLLKS
uniref:Tyrosine-protein kinase n=1 Tax=Parastrongyloides trichosuri TaxID=131310 RepID=A0A0N4ZNF4_PARTI